MKLFITFSKKGIALLLAALIVGLLAISRITALNRGGIDGATNAERLDYAESLGLAVEETAIEAREIVIPETFSDVYSKYNQLQAQAGFDLSGYRGKNATVYAYALSGREEWRLHLIVCDGKVIGGDISSVRIDGEMLPLCPQNGENANGTRAAG